MRRFGGILALLAALGALPAQAQCRGVDLIADLPPDAATPLRAAADAVPFARGNAWRATRGDQEMILVGTLHLDDARFDPVMSNLLPLLESSALLLVEAGPAEVAQLTRQLSRDPSILVNTDGPTLPELLPDDQWQALSGAMAARGVPGFMAAKFRPWYVSVLLSMPPCAMTGTTAGGLPNGLDQRLIAHATDRAIAIMGLEPFDTAFKVFQDGTLDEQIAMLSGAIAAESQSENMTATMINSYFAEDVRLSWEFSKYWVQTLPGYDPVAAQAEFDLMENRLMYGRNQAWIPVIEQALADTDGRVFAAFGALHLAGDQGVLALLQARGFTVDRIAFQ